MRIRLSTTLPLPPLKAWYLLPSTVETIADLKAQLVADLPAFKGIKPRLLAFEVDGFEVLDASRCEVLNEERDVLCVKLHDSPLSTSTKRKKSHSEAPLMAASPEPSSSSASRKKRKLSPARVSPPIDKAKAKSVPPSAPALTPVEVQKAKRSKAAIPPPPPPPPPPPASVQVPQPKPVAKRPAPSESSESDSTGSSDSDSNSDSGSDDDSSSSGSSSSSSDESDSSSSSSASSGAPEASSSKLIPTGRALPAVESTSAKGKGKEPKSTAIRLTPIIPDQPPVPPGLGLNATHERNVRRRKKKAALKLLRASAQPADPSSSTLTLASSSTPQKPTPATPAASGSMLPPAIPSPSPFLSTQPSASTSTSSSSTSDIAPLPFLANSNRNKKRDFKKAMATAVGQKTVFAQPDTPIYSSVPPPPPPPAPPAAALATPSRVQSVQRSNSGMSTPTSGGKRPYQHVLAPSERTTLPSNMFVTSVDVETAEWEAAQGWGVEEVQQVESRVKASQKGDVGGSGKGGEQKEGGGGKGGDRKGREEDGADGSREWADYIRAEEESTSTAANANGGSAVGKEVDWATVDAAFEVGPPVTSMGQLRVGATVGWKELILSPLTFTPELSVLVGTIVAIDTTSLLPTVSLKMEDRPLPVDPDGDDDQDMWDEGERRSTNHEVDPVEVELRVAGAEEVLSGGWRVL